MIDFTNIAYLRNGSEKQQSAYQSLTRSRIMEKLTGYSPILAGTIPIGIEIESSDLDIICCFSDKEVFFQALITLFSKEKQFHIYERTEEGRPVVVANFIIGSFEIEVFGTNIPAIKQNAYRHMLIEYRLLQTHGEDFRQQVIDLKRKGYKTEPAFALLLGIEGDAFKELLKLEEESKPELS